jgi:hypothetical protein
MNINVMHAGKVLISNHFSARTETMCKWLHFNSKTASNAVSNCQICKCSFSTKIGTGKLGRISRENQPQTSNREGNRATTFNSNNVCFAVAIVCAILVGSGKYENFSLIFHLVKNSTKEESDQSVQIVSFKRQLPYSVSLSQ